MILGVTQGLILGGPIGGNMYPYNMAVGGSQIYNPWVLSSNSTSPYTALGAMQPSMWQMVEGDQLTCHLDYKRGAAKGGRKGAIWNKYIRCKGIPPRFPGTKVKRPGLSP